MIFDGIIKHFPSNIIKCLQQSNNPKSSYYVVFIDSHKRLLILCPVYKNALYDERRRIQKQRKTFFSPVVFPLFFHYRLLFLPLLQQNYAHCSKILKKLSFEFRAKTIFSFLLVSLIFPIFEFFRQNMICNSDFWRKNSNIFW